MSSTARSPSELFVHIESSTISESRNVQAGSAVPESKVFSFSVPAKDNALASKHTDFLSFMNELESDKNNDEHFLNAGRYIVDRFYKDEGLTIKTARLRKGLSQKQLADILGTSQPHIANIEKGKGDIYLSTAAKLCESLGLALDELPKIIERQRAATKPRAAK